MAKEPLYLKKDEVIPSEVLEAMAAAYEELGYDGEVRSIESELDSRLAAEMNY